MAKVSRNRAVLKRTLKKKRQGGKNLYGIKQGVGGITKSAFPRPKRTANKAASAVKYGLNAMHPSHLPLPRAVGGYSVIRTTDILSSNQPATLIGCFKGPGQQFTETCWLDTIYVSNREGGVDLPINDATGGGNAFFFGSAALAAQSMNGARMVPAAITVQIMNGKALQNADGICYIGRSKTVLDLMGDSRTWTTVMKELVSYSAPRLCSGGKLALRGVQVNAVPNNMSVLSDFVPRRLPQNGDQTWTEATFAADFEGFGPIFVYNPDRIDLKYLVTIEWRMRFDPLNPAYAGHSVHTPASESTWSKVIGEAESAGNGVVDIADVVADYGIVRALAPLLA
uniref:Putative capsid n=1 Tax=Barns Ness breadcrumb sponge weivirus-like virus 3 TaxID=2021890 RepID=A0A221LFI5_9VIRU|nr:putative capsid [Barns Ness breadcrumb sponge weivirus-like virus 3]